MPKKIFWPLVIIIFALIYIATQMGFLPPEYWNLWPIIAIVAGLAGLLTYDRDEWMSDEKTVKKAAKVMEKPAVKAATPKPKVAKKTKKVVKKKK